MATATLLDLVRLLFLAGLIFAWCACPHPNRETDPAPSSHSSSESQRGHILEADGRPAVGVETFVTHPWFERDIYEGARTNDAGSFTIAEQESANSIVIARSKAGDLAFTRVPKKDALTMTFRPATDLTLPFIGVDGKPLANCTVALFPSIDKAPLEGVVVDRGFPNFPETLKNRFMGKTDAHGMLKLDGLPQGGRISVTIQVGEERPPMVLRGSLLLAKKPMTTAEPIQIALTGSISGRVTYRLTGKPVANGTVELTGPGYHNRMGMARTDSEGRYRFENLAPSAYYVGMQNEMMKASDALPDNPSSLESLYMVRSAHGNSAVKVGREEQVSGIDFTFAKSAIVKGKVVDANGRPVFGATVTASLSDGSGEGHTTGLDGTYRILVPPGRVKVSYTPTDGGEHTVNAPWISLSEGETRTVDLGPTGVHTAIVR